MSPSHASAYSSSVRKQVPKSRNKIEEQNRATKSKATKSKATKSQATKSQATKSQATKSQATLFFEISKLDVKFNYN